MRTIGITGRSGCGKSTVSAHYRALGYRVADADLVARQVLEPGSACIPLLVEQFGADILNRQAGGIQRRLLADRAFARPDGSQRLVTSPTRRSCAVCCRRAKRPGRQGRGVFCGWCGHCGRTL